MYGGISCIALLSSVALFRAIVARSLASVIHPIPGQMWMKLRFPPLEEVGAVLSVSALLFSPWRSLSSADLLIVCDEI